MFPVRASMQEACNNSGSNGDDGDGAIIGFNTQGLGDVTAVRIQRRGHRPDVSDLILRGIRNLNV
jgi:hypothetical protein